LDLRVLMAMLGHRENLVHKVTKVFRVKLD
jgi:hypothetical protein